MKDGKIKGTEWKRNNHQVLGWVFSRAVKMPIEIPAAYNRGPGFRFWLHPQFQLPANWEAAMMAEAAAFLPSMWETSG